MFRLVLAAALLLAAAAAAAAQSPLVAELEVGSRWERLVHHPLLHVLDK